MSSEPKTPLSSQPSDAENDSPRLVVLEDSASPGAPATTRARLWGHRIAVLLFVFFCAALGVILVVYPWSDDWGNNRLLLGHPALQDWLAHPFVRGLCSGLGLLDIWIGFWEAVHYHD